MLLKQPQFIICVYQNGLVVPIAEFENYSSANWGKSFFGFKEIEFTAPLTNENVNLLKDGNYIHDVVYNISAKIEIVTYTKTKEMEMIINVKGRTLECLLLQRVLFDTEVFKNKHLSTIMFQMVDKHIVNPINQARKISGFINLPDSNIGDIITTQKTGGSLYSFFNEISESHDFGFEVFIDLQQSSFVFKSKMSIDKSIEQNLVPPIIFSSDTEDIISDEFYINSQNYCSMAYVAGEGENSERKIIEVNENQLFVGIDRKELYVDAKDLQKKEDIADTEYESILTQRGIAKLSENEVVQNFTGKINSYRINLKEDFDVGDIVTVVDKDFGVYINAIIESYKVIITPQNGIQPVISFGNSLPSLYKRLRNLI